jgi:hypothetical protein
MPYFYSNYLFLFFFYLNKNMLDICSVILQKVNFVTFILQKYILLRGEGGPPVWTSSVL